MRTVLIIEDEQHYREFLRKLVGKKYICDCASGGDEAKHLLKKNHYDIVLYDLRLPGLSGRELIRFVRREVDPDIVNIVITGYEEDWSPVEATEENVFYYLKKGKFTPAELLKVMESASRLIDMREKEREYINECITSAKIEQAGKIAASIAHEVNNPLQCLFLIIDLLKEKIEGLENSQPLMKDLGLLESGIERIHLIVRQLLQLQNLDKGPSGRERVERIIEKAVNFLNPVAREFGTEIIVHRMNHGSCILASENQLFFVIVNTCLILLDQFHGRVEITIGSTDQKKPDAFSIHISTTKDHIEEKTITRKTKKSFYKGFSSLFALKRIITRYNCELIVDVNREGNALTIRIPLDE
jgi:CheY-like chemotaxis protein